MNGPGTRPDDRNPLDRLIEAAGDGDDALVVDWLKRLAAGTESSEGEQRPAGRRGQPADAA